MTIRKNRFKATLRTIAAWAGPSLALGGLAAPTLAEAAALDVYYERSVMASADGRCRLFEPAIGSALAAGQLQARGAALRTGSTEMQILTVEQRARATAGRIACDSKDMTIAADRVRGAFEGFAKLSRINYPGDYAEWRADRGPTRETRWRLAQSVRFGWNQMVFGLAGREDSGVLMAVANFADGRAPYAARLILRDVARTPGPYLAARGAETKIGLPLARRLPPDSAAVIYAAEARSTAGQDLLPKDLKSGWAFRFPAEAAVKMAKLDPREAVAVEFTFSGAPDETVRAYVEVGDFAAGRAFLTLAQR